MAACCSTRPSCSATSASAAVESRFLLRPNELLEAFAGRLNVVAFEQGEVARPKPAMVQRLCAVRGTGPILLP